MAELIIALDYHEEKKALEMANMMQGLAPWVKIGLELYISQGPPIIKKIKDLGFKVFLDLKLYDIPNTVKGATKSAIDLGVDLLTIHLFGGRKMCEAALSEVEKQNSEMSVFGVSVLTSFGEGELPGVSHNLDKMVEILVQDAKKVGLHGIVCSGQELGKMKALAPQLKFLTPGIRLADATDTANAKGQKDDQKRIITPKIAVTEGADFLVVGRPITMSKDPKQACINIINDMKI